MPLSVAMLDMDWHITNVDKSFGRGWTGYTFNTALIGNPPKFLKELEKQGYKTALNVRPSSGIRPYERAYDEIAAELNIIDETRPTIPFDITNTGFVNAYFKYLHHPLETLGVDFWWIDMLEGIRSKHKDLDPRWLINRYHYKDIARDGKRPLILSRYAGAGGHRYPLARSGDTAISWRVLKFQPYFTATASNIGFPFWSHDIGGHHMGRRDDELYLRWVQFGAFSPTLRLHSARGDFLGKEPWNYRKDVETFIGFFMRLRHKLIPYIYTANHKMHTEGTPLCRPVYHLYPQSKSAYKKKYRNQYFFGSELLVIPITQKAKRKLAMGRVNAFIPHGKWTDIFTGFEYEGEKEISLFRTNGSIPVLAKNGAIIVHADYHGNDVKIPQKFEIHIFAGIDNSYTLFEDNDEDMTYKNGQFATTTIDLLGDEENFELKINKPEGDLSLLPPLRTYKILLRNITSADIETFTDNAAFEADISKNIKSEVEIYIKDKSIRRDIIIKVTNAKKKTITKKGLRAKIIARSQISNNLKPLYYNGVLTPFKGTFYQALKEAEYIVNAEGEIDEK
jgi:alpha-glucosidase (family GH31 glycosyl hydrolase)